MTDRGATDRGATDRGATDRGLERWGANAEVIVALERLQSGQHRDTVAGRVARVDRTALRVVLASGELRSSDGGLGPLCVGDWVLVAGGTGGLDSRPDPAAGAHHVQAVLDRRSALTRSAGTGLAPQTLAANLDEVLIVVALDQPVEASRLERLLTLCGDSGAMPRVIVTKSDLGGGAAIVHAVEAAGPGVPVTLVSVRDRTGIDEVLATLGTGRTAALVGSSGAGKSSLVNALVGSELVQVGSLRARDGKGRHTTSWRELVALPSGGVVIDTPGIRSLGLWLDEGGLDETFSEILDYARLCRFSDCTHRPEPGCAVIGAVASGALGRRRLDSYFKLQEEAELVASRNETRAVRVHSGGRSAAGRSEGSRSRQR